MERFVAAAAHDVKEAERFFSFLPADWRDEMAPCWEKYRRTTKIYLLKNGGRIAAGGMVSSTPFPDTAAYRRRALMFFARGCLYLGFLYIDPKLRGRGLGSRWMREGISVRLRP